MYIQTTVEDNAGQGGRMSEPKEPSGKQRIVWSRDEWSSDTRLTINIRKDLHVLLKTRAAQEGTTMGELIESWIESWAERPPQR
jgi:hypothetical protein